MRAEVPGFLFIAEVYWDLEWTLQQQGFDYAYDKRLYDRLERATHVPCAEHLCAGLDFQDHLARFLENHDEPRAAATFTPEAHRAAAILTFLTPGLRFFHQGQREGKRMRIPVHLGRGPVEAAEPGDRRVLRRPAGMPEGPGLSRRRLAAPRVPSCVGRERDLGRLRRFLLDRPGRSCAASSPSTTRLTRASATWRCRGTTWKGGPGASRTLPGPRVYDRDGDDLTRQGLYLDMPAWGYHVFAVSHAR